MVHSLNFIVSRSGDARPIADGKVSDVINDSSKVSIQGIGIMHS